MLRIYDNRGRELGNFGLGNSEIQQPEQPGDNYTLYCDKTIQISNFKISQSKIPKWHSDTVTPLRVESLA